jgi:ribose/xylose/arabinose/galactoside ABC-type transport system permease subunit
VLPHVVWESVLVVLVIIATVVAALQGHFFSTSGLWAGLALLGLPAAALSLSFRTGTPNLGVVAIAAMSQLIYVELADSGWPGILSAVVAVLAALVLGLILAVITGLTGLPGWAVSLVGLATAETVVFARGRETHLLRDGGLSPTVLIVFALLFVVGSIGGGALWLMPQIRLGLGPTPGEETPALGVRLRRAAVGLGGSSMIAGLVGVVTAQYIGASPGPGDLTQLLYVLGAVLLGGASLTGRGGGVAGTVLAVYLISAARFITVVANLPFWVGELLLSTLAIVIGLVAGGLLDRLSVRIGGPSLGAPPPLAQPAGYQYPPGPYPPGGPQQFGGPPPAGPPWQQ